MESARASVDPREIDQFERLGADWWREDGPMRPLHKMNPVRVRWMRAAMVEHFAGFDGAAHGQQWPAHDDSLLVQNEVEIVLQINGKVRDKMVVAKDASREQLEAAARAHEKIAAQIEGKEVVKVVAVPGKLVNFVVKA